MASLSHLGLITVIITWILTCLAFISILSSVYLLVVITKKFAIHDYLNLLAFLIGLLLVVQTTWAVVAEGEGNSQFNLTNHQVSLIAKSILVNEVLWTLANTLLRVSTCLSTLQLFCFGGINRYVRVLSWALICLSVTHGTTSIVELFLICRPLSAQWNPVDGTCGDQKTSYIVIEICALVLDIIIILMPFKIILRLHLDVKKKCTLLAIFSVSSLLLIITALRLKSLHLAVSPDFVYSQSYLGLLSATGTMLAIVLCISVHLPKIAREAEKLWKEWKERRTHDGANLETSDSCS
ncbi:hypothetical protein K505DRAFT_241944 [Melanomma pulvis-pyrius CBS 109.77]|uniref:Rhodopsin domain-containing protein n=1 Tax=Melanomma pulvis-pyrius CBS 109.77 TaxID=1314802 RepID=A0A6A6XEQ6_9PLEO|nr:hypothetical protein K505DRAFT_241944 [Melanomma pulvis-pyrius CBS 109.77]